MVSFHLLPCLSAASSLARFGIAALWLVPCWNIVVLWRKRAAKVLSQMVKRQQRTSVGTYLQCGAEHLTPAFTYNSFVVYWKASTWYVWQLAIGKSHPYWEIPKHQLFFLVLKWWRELRGFSLRMMFEITWFVTITWFGTDCLLICFHASYVAYGLSRCPNFPTLKALNWAHCKVPNYTHL